MTGVLEAALIFTILADLVLLGSNGWRFGIRVVALQGLAVGIAPLLLPGHNVTLSTLDQIAGVYGVSGYNLISPRLPRSTVPNAARSTKR